MWPFFLILTLHSLVIFLFSHDFLLTRTELSSFSHCSDLSQANSSNPCSFPSQPEPEPEPDGKCWTRPTVDRLVMIVLDALRNPQLKSIPNLANDLQKVYLLMSRTNKDEPLNFGFEETREEKEEETSPSSGNDSSFLEDQQVVTNQPNDRFLPDYTAPPRPNPDETTIDISGVWTIIGTPLELCDPRILAMAAE
ncbi:uncharacterized protein A4U43_C06F11770 [Asparagus officinalis]|uniref:Uncharacterized protein n=1 Tax=Asparagus officinalis TaxID=4686 RepID=A0A5P1EQD4_ASPOF|nr:uncharacterized protein A4U43_C06F11770 [Asparagus officinalis]